MDVPSPERCSRLTAHKALPKKRAVSDDSTASHDPANSSRRDYASPSKDDRIASWIRDASPNLPLTPPDDRGSDVEMMEEPGAEEGEAVHARPSHREPSNEASGSATPVNHSPPIAPVGQRSPPTPEMTPPKKVRTRDRSASPPLRRRNRTSLSPPPTSRQASSKAESFRTAAEQLSSPAPSLTADLAGSKPPVLAFQSPSPTEELASRPNTTDSIGLGIGMTEEEDACTPTRNRPMSFADRSAIVDQVFHSKETTPEVVDSDPMVASEASAVTELSRETELLRPAYDEETYQGFSYINDDDTPYKERPYFHEPTHMENGLAQSDLESARSVSPLSETFDPDEALLDQARRESRRVSEMSNFSMPRSVEVMVIDNVPKQRQRLRHASKNASLRAASDSVGDSNRSSLQSSNDYKPRLNRMLGGLTNATANSSLHSDSGISMVGSDHIMKRWSKLAATDIPRRQTSITQSQYNPSPDSSPKYNSSAAAMTSSRPATAPSGQEASPELRSMKKRTVSTGSGNSHDAGSRRGRHLASMGPPHIPKRTSSVGATNREASGSSSSSSQAGPSVPRADGHSRSVSQSIPQKQTSSNEAKAPKQKGTKPASQRKVDQRPEKQLVQQPLEHIGREKASHARQTSQQSTTSAQPLTPVITLSPTGPDEQLSPKLPLWMRRSSEISEPNALATRTVTPRRGSKEDAALLASRALLKTPFSGNSVQSAFSGTYEVHEATAINIYPHTNSSLLVIQQATPNTGDFPAHPGVRPGAYRVTEISSQMSSDRARQPESMHVKIEGPETSPTQVSERTTSGPTFPYDSPLRNPRPAPPAPTSEAGTLPSVKLIPPTPLDLQMPGSRMQSSSKAAITSGPVSLVRRALSSTTRASAGSLPRTSGHWLTLGRKRNTGAIQKKHSQPVLKEDSLSPFWKPKKFWDDEDDYESELNDTQGDATGFGAIRGAGEGSSGARPVTVPSKSRNVPATGDYFSRPVRNTLGIPQSRVVISGPASLVRRLSSIRRYRSLKRKKFPTATQPPRPLSPSSLTRNAPRPSSVQRRSSLPRGVRATTPVRVISPTPSAMARRRRSQKRSVRFEFNPMRGFSGTSAESPGWATRAMRRRSEKKAEKRRQQLKGNIGQPRLETVLE